MIATMMHFLLFVIGGQQMRFAQDPARRLMLDESCARSRQCLAFRGFERTEKEELGGQDQPAASLGAWLCRGPLKGTVVRGFDPSGNQNSFCAFSDGSYIDTG